MGEEVDFLGQEGVASPALIAKLRAVDPKVKDPELLARLLAGMAGIDIDFSLFGFEGELRAARLNAFADLQKIRRHCDALTKLRMEHRNFDLLEYALTDLLDDAVLDRTGLASKVADAISLISEVKIRQNLRKFATRPASDPAAIRAVEAVATYFHRIDATYTGAPRRAQADNQPVHLIKTDAAKVTQAVLAILGWSVTDRYLGTLMRQAKQRVPGK